MLITYAEQEGTGLVSLVGSGPEGAAFYGASIWVANSGSNIVTKLRASDGKSLPKPSGADRKSGKPFGSWNSVSPARRYGIAMAKIRKVRECSTYVTGGQKKSGDFTAPATTSQIQVGSVASRYPNARPPLPTTRSSSLKKSAAVRWGGSMKL